MTCHIFIHVHYLRTRIKAGIRKSTKYYSGTCRYFEEFEEISFNKKNLKKPLIADLWQRAQRAAMVQKCQ